MNRRQFLRFAAIPLVAVPSISYFLAPKGGWPSDFSTANLRYKCTERFSVCGNDWRAMFATKGNWGINPPASGQALEVRDLNEDSLEQIEIELRDATERLGQRIVIKPSTRLLTADEFRAQVIKIAEECFL